MNEKREAFDKDRLIEELKRVEMEKVKENEEMKSYYEHLVDEGKRTNEELKRALSRAEYVNTEKVEASCKYSFLFLLLHALSLEAFTI